MKAEKAMPEKLTYSVKEAAEILGLSTDSIRNMDVNGILPRLKKLPGIHFAKKDVLACANVVEQDVRPSMLRKLKSDLEKEQAENERLRSVIRRICAGVNQAAAQEGL